MKEEPKIYITITSNTGEKVRRYCRPNSCVKILNNEANLFTDGSPSIAIRVVYGKVKQGKKWEIIDNEGTYENTEEAVLALKAFLDKDLWLVTV